jgi:hypothetical protein
MRGVELGMTLDAFKTFPPVPFEGRVNVRPVCDDKPLPSGIYMSEALPDDKDLGVVSCQWVSDYESTTYLRSQEHWVNLGEGQGPPLFQFFQSGGAMHLFRISFYANNEYYPGIKAALVQNYGSAVSRTETLHNKMGTAIPSLTSSWTNGLSGIELNEKCRQVDRYCLTYRHYAYSKPYLAAAAQRHADRGSQI